MGCCLGIQVKHDDLKEARLFYIQALEDAEAYLLVNELPR